MQQQQQQSEDPLSCPTFNSYSSDRLAEIGKNVSDEFKRDSEATGHDDGFEFSLVLEDPEASADEIAYQGPVFPVFNRDLINDQDKEVIKRNDDASALIQVPLRNLFIEEREPPSSSSSEADELESVPPGTYCVWRPKFVQSSPATCKKSKSTGSASKRFRIRDLLRRSNSDGKDSFVFLTPKNHSQAKAETSEKVDSLKLRQHSVEAGKVTGKLKAPPSPSSSAHELFYLQNRSMKEGEKRKSYLPYRKDLVGFFTNVNGSGKASKAFPRF